MTNDNSYSSDDSPRSKQKRAIRQAAKLLKGKNEHLTITKTRDAETQTRGMKRGIIWDFKLIATICGIVIIFGGFVMTVSEIKTGLADSRQWSVYNSEKVDALMDTAPTWKKDINQNFVDTFKNFEEIMKLNSNNNGMKTDLLALQSNMTAKAIDKLFEKVIALELKLNAIESSVKNVGNQVCSISRYP